MMYGHGIILMPIPAQNSFPVPLFLTTQSCAHLHACDIPLLAGEIFPWAEASKERPPKNRG